MRKKYEGQGSAFSLELLAEEKEPRPPTEEAARSDRPHPSIPASFSPISCLTAGLSLQAQHAPQPAPEWGHRDPRTPVVSSQAWGRKAAVRLPRTQGGHQMCRAEPAQQRGLWPRAHPRLPGPARPHGHCFWADSGAFASVLHSSEPERPVQQGGAPPRFSPGFM